LGGTVGEWDCLSGKMVAQPGRKRKGNGFLKSARSRKRGGKSPRKQARETDRDTDRKKWRLRKSWVKFWEGKKKKKKGKGETGQTGGDREPLIPNQRNWGET